jgi:hypothetical protein
MPKLCKSIGCHNTLSIHDVDFCTSCNDQTLFDDAPLPNDASLSERYPQYYKAVGELEEIDVYAVHHLFNIQDPAGCIQHASKKLLLSGVRTGGKSQFKDIKEARDTLTRWLQLNPETP